jgi:hypothetical protein
VCIWPGIFGFKKGLLTTKNILPDFNNICYDFFISIFGYVEVTRIEFICMNVPQTCQLYEKYGISSLCLYCSLHTHTYTHTHLENGNCSVPSSIVTVFVNMTTVSIPYLH